MRISIKCLWNCTLSVELHALPSALRAVGIEELEKEILARFPLQPSSKGMHYLSTRGAAFNLSHSSSIEIGSTASSSSICGNASKALFSDCGLFITQLLAPVNPVCCAGLGSAGVLSPDEWRPGSDLGRPYFKRMLPQVLPQLMQRSRYL